MKKILSIIMFVMFTNVALAGTMRHDVSENKFLEFGSRFFCTKKIVGVKETEDGKTYAVASCVILNENWIITCAHITEEKIDYLSVIIDDKPYLLDKFIVNKDFDSKKMQADIAMGYCSKGFGEINGVELYRKKIKINDFCSFAGYGRYGTMLDGATKFDGKLRGGTNLIDSFFKSDMVTITGSRNNSRTRLEFLPNVGDSGGGLFVQGKLAGITSLVLSADKKADSNYGDEGAFVQIYPHLEWIEKNVKKR
jgi:hypothetical protein